MLCHAMLACLCEKGKFFGPTHPSLNKLGGTTITHVLLLGLALALCLKVYINSYVTLMFLPVCALCFLLCTVTLGHHPPPAQGKPAPLLSHRDGCNLRLGSLIVHELRLADSSRPWIFSLLSSSAYSHCASYTQASMRVWQSSTA